MSNKYECGFICGRFQVMHKGHEKLIDTALRVCKRMIIFVGSAQESETMRNPFNYELRKKVIKTIYPQDNVEVYPINDLTHEDDISPEWGTYLLDNIKKVNNGKLPDIMIYGNDEARSKWFKKEDISDIGEMIISRDIYPISATEARKALIEDKEKWLSMHNPKIYHLYGELRSILLYLYPMNNYSGTHMNKILTGEDKGFSLRSKNNSSSLNGNTICNEPTFPKPPIPGSDIKHEDHLDIVDIRMFLMKRLGMTYEEIENKPLQMQLDLFSYYQILDNSTRYGSKHRTKNMSADINKMVAIVGDPIKPIHVKMVAPSISEISRVKIDSEYPTIGIAVPVEVVVDTMKKAGFVKKEKEFETSIKRRKTNFKKSNKK